MQHRYLIAVFFFLAVSPSFGEHSSSEVQRLPRVNEEQSASDSRGRAPTEAEKTRERKASLKKLAEGDLQAISALEKETPAKVAEELLGEALQETTNQYLQDFPVLDQTLKGIEGIAKKMEEPGSDFASALGQSVLDSLNKKLEKPSELSPNALAKLVIARNSLSLAMLSKQGSQDLTEAKAAFAEAKALMLRGKMDGKGMMKVGEAFGKLGSTLTGEAKRDAELFGKQAFQDVLAVGIVTNERTNFAARELVSNLMARELASQVQGKGTNLNDLVTADKVWQEGLKKDVEAGRMSSQQAENLMRMKNVAMAVASAPGALDSAKKLYESYNLTPDQRVIVARAELLQLERNQRDAMVLKTSPFPIGREGDIRDGTDPKNLEEVFGFKAKLEKPIVQPIAVESKAPPLLPSKARERLYRLPALSEEVR